MLIKELLLKYALYNQWAHKRLLDLICTLTVGQQHAIVPSSFESLYKTVFHVWGAESLWLGRLNQEPIKLSGDPFNESMEKLSEALEAVDQLWVDWFESKEDNQLTEQIHYKNLAGLPFHQSYDLLLHHIFNHSTYHNGQLVTMLRTLGVDK
ncbi:MAG TPA: DinB family protein, partial [Chitinophagaceae bacterium]|nr:DinB family protein [Chitinophagaceae bacterium]